MSFRSPSQSSWQDAVVHTQTQVDMIISPNLDAALDHDERTRTRDHIPVRPPRRHAPEPAALVGLPPPPRGKQRILVPPPAPTLPPPEVPGYLQTQPFQSSKSNPYINPPPTLYEQPQPQVYASVGDVHLIGRPREGSVSTIETTDSRHSDSPDQHAPHAPQSHVHTSLARPFAKARQVLMSGGSGESSAAARSPSFPDSQLASPPPCGNVSPSERKSKFGSRLFSSRGQGNINSKYEVATGIGGDVKDIDGTWRPQRRPLINTHPLTIQYPPSPSSYHHQPMPRGSYSPGQGSFMDMMSPETPNFEDVDLTPVAGERPQPVKSPMEEEEPIPHQATVAEAPPASTKPPIPSTPKPNFYTSGSTPNSHRSLNIVGEPGPNNTLNASERAALVNKSRKLAKVFGTTPAAVAVKHEELRLAAANGRASPAHSQLDPPFKIHKRGAFSTSAASLGSFAHIAPASEWALPEETMYINANGERRPRQASNGTVLGGRDSLDEDDASNAVIDIAAQRHHGGGGGSGENDTRPRGRRTASGRSRADSANSFIDLSDEDDTGNDDLSPLSQLPRRGSSLLFGRGQHINTFDMPYSPSIAEAMTDEEKLDDERRRKREKLARLHRFLGSRVPMELALGSDYSGILPALPDVAPADLVKQDEEEERKVWIRRRRSSSAAAFPSTWSEDIERLKEDLNDEEKAQNVKRGKKMEKVFGVLPPQTLYHTRQSPSPSTRPESPPASKLSVPTRSNGTGRMSPNPRPSISPRASSYGKKHRKSGRPGTSDSATQLLPDKEYQQFGYMDSDAALDARTKDVYQHYQQSLHSLHDILDRDDKESLAELHDYLNQDALPSPALQEFTRIGERRASNASLKSERRRSLPARTSMISVYDEYSVSTLKPNVTDFQLRRRRAAKLTQFFGVDYKDLIFDVLESIEKGLEDESKRGTLNPEEVEELLKKLRALKKRGGF